MFSPQERHDKTIRSTDLEALSCRQHATSTNYLEDPYINHLIKSYNNYLHLTPGYTSMSASRFLKSCFNTPKLPLINRGTYIRTKSIDSVIDQFIVQHNTCQIVSLGSGSDTRVFSLLEKYHNLVYHEIDFPHSTKIKALSILSTPELADFIYDSPPNIQINGKASKEEFESYPFEIHSPRYHLHGYDLRDLTPSTITDSFKLNAELPTLIISECVLCYLSPAQTTNILKIFKTQLSKGCFVVYEPMSNNDNFGQVMIKNLSSRGISLPSFEKFPTAQSRYNYFQELGFTNIKISNMTFVMNLVEQGELNRINRLEILDEVEEINLLNDHYVLCVFEFGGLGLHLNQKFMIE